MLKTEQMLSVEEEYRLTIKYNDKEVTAESGIIRTFSHEKLLFNLQLKNSPASRTPVLYTNLKNSEWEFIPFSKETVSENNYLLELEMPCCGIFHYKFALSEEDNLYWAPEDYQKLLVDPALTESIRMYTLIPNVTGNVAEWIRKLDSIRDMGFNVVHLLPVTMMGSSESPYSSVELFNIDFSYSENISGFKQFAKAAKEKGLTLCLDMVLNHISSENEIVSRKADWLVPDKEREDGLKRAGCWHNNSWISWEDLVLINYDHPDIEKRNEIYEYMKSYVSWWIELADTGSIMIRLDNLHSSNKDFIEWLIIELKTEYPNTVILSEFFGAEKDIDDAVKHFGLNLLTANSWEYPFVPLLQNYIHSIHEDKRAARFLITPTSHDTGTAAELFSTALSSIPRYLCCALMGTGQTGMVQGFEYGVKEKINFIGRNNPPPEEDEFDFRDFIKDVNHVLEDYDCLRRHGNISFITTGNESIIAGIRKSETENFLIAANFDIHNFHSFNYHYRGEREILISENSRIREADNGDNLVIEMGSCGACVVKLLYNQ